MPLTFPPPPDGAEAAITASYADVSTPPGRRVKRAASVRLAGPIPLVRWTVASISGEKPLPGLALFWRFLVVRGIRVVETADVRRLPRRGYRLVALKSAGADRWRLALGRAEAYPTVKEHDFTVWGLVIPELGLSAVWLRPARGRGDLFIPVRAGSLSRQPMTRGDFLSELLRVHVARHLYPSTNLVPRKLPKPAKLPDKFI